MLRRSLYLLAVPGLILNSLSRMIFDIYGYVITAYFRCEGGVPLKGDEIFPNKIVNGQPVFDIDDPTSRAYAYAALRKSLLLEFVNEYALDALIIFGCAYGRELVPVAKQLLVDKPAVKVVGADLSEKAISACRAYGLPSAEFVVMDMENERHVSSLVEESCASASRVGVYMSETAAYLLPHKLKQFIDAIGSNKRIVGLQLIEPAYIDWKSAWQSGMIFSFQKGFWRHNYPRMIERAFKIDRTYFLDAKLRSDVHIDQPLWFIRAGR